MAAELAALGVERADVAAELEALTTADWHLADGVVPPPAWLDQAAYADLLALRAALPDAAIEFDPTLVRGMGYYTGTIFEIAHPDLGYSLGGGGRYDHMIGRFLGQEVPACGFSIGFERIVDLLAMRDEGRPRRGRARLRRRGRAVDAALTEARARGIRGPGPLRTSHQEPARAARSGDRRRLRRVRPGRPDTTDAASLSFRELSA